MSNSQITDYELRKYFPGASKSTIAKNRCLPENSQQEQDPCDEPLAETSRKTANAVRRTVRITSYRCKQLDERNLFDAYFVDALTYAGVLFDDAPKWAQIEICQSLVAEPATECTVIEITPWP